MRTFHSIPFALLLGLAVQQQTVSHQHRPRYDPQTTLSVANRVDPRILLAQTPGIPERIAANLIDGHVFWQVRSLAGARSHEAIYDANGRPVLRLPTGRSITTFESTLEKAA